MGVDSTGGFFLGFPAFCLFVCLFAVVVVVVVVVCLLLLLLGFFLVFFVLFFFCFFFHDFSEITGSHLLFNSFLRLIHNVSLMPLNFVVFSQANLLFILKVILTYL